MGNTVPSGSTPDPSNLNVSVRQRIQDFEKLSGKSSNGRSVQVSEKSQKTESVAQEAMPAVNLDKLKQSPLPWIKPTRPVNEQTKVAAQHRIPAQHRTNEVGKQALVEQRSPQPVFLPDKAKPEEIDKLKNQIATLREGINTLNREPSKKLAARDGIFGATTRRFGITLGRSSSTKAVLDSLKQMETVALRSNDAELLSQYVGLLKDLRQTNWVKTIEGRNKTFKTRLDGLSKSIEAGFEKRVNAEAQLDIFNANNTNDREVLQNTIQSLEERKSLPNLPEGQKTVFDASIGTARASLQRVDERTVEDHLLNLDTYTKGRDLLISAAGTHIEGHELVKPMASALARAKEHLPYDEQIPAISSLLQAAAKFAALPDDQLDQKFTAQDAKDHHLDGMTLRESLKQLYEETKGMDEPEVRAYGDALEILLGEKPKEISLDKFREAFTAEDFSRAFSALGPLTFLNHGELQKPLDPSIPNSPTVNQAIESVLEKFRGEPAYKKDVTTIETLREANAEKADPSPLEISEQNTTSFDQDLTAVREGLEGQERDDLIRDLTQDMRAQFGSIIKSIGLDELRGKEFEKEHKKEKAPQLSRGIQLYNDVSTSITTHILNPQKSLQTSSGKTTEQEQRETLNTIIFYADLLESCIEDRNYTAVGAITSGLNDAAVQRILKIPNLNVPEKTKAILARGEAIIKAEGSFKGYRDAVAAAKKEEGPPPVPFLATLASDLIFAEDGNENKVYGRFNLNKDAVHTSITQEFKGLRDGLELTPTVRTSFFGEMPIAEEYEPPARGGHNLKSINYERSLELFPREAPKKSFLSKFFQRKVQKSE